MVFWRFFKGRFFLFLYIFFFFSFNSNRALDVGLCIFTLLERRGPGSCQGGSFMSTLKQKKKKEKTGA